MGGAPKETTTKVEPWDGAKPYLLDYYALYDKAIKEGKPEYFQGSTIADQSQATKDANAMAEQLARDPNNSSSLTNASNALGQIAAGGTAPGNATLTAGQNYQNAGMGATQAALNNINPNWQNPALAGAQALTGQGGNNPVGNNLANMAAGGEIGNNPYLEQSITNQTQKIADQLRNTTLPGLQGNAALAGRSGSGTFARMVNNATDTAANQMSKVATDMYANQYNADKQNQLAANSQVGNAYNSNFTNNLNANQNYGNMASNQNSANQAAINQQLAGAGQLGSQSDSQQGLQNSAANSLNQQYNQGQQNQIAAAGQAGQAYQNQFLPYEMLAQIGGQRDTRAQDELNAKISEFEFNQQMPLQQYANMVNLLTTGNYSTQSQKTTGGSSVLGNLFGGLSSILGMGMSLSDRRMKENIKYLGNAPTGHKMYSYNYIGEEETFVGPMAQEIAETNPEMVIEHNDNLFIDSGIFERMAG